MTPNRCLLGISDATLSDWRNDLLPPDEAQRLTDHLPTCQACQAHVIAMTRIGELLRAQRVPHASEVVWRSVHDSLQYKGRNTMTNLQKTLALSGLGTAAIVVTLFAIILVAFNGHKPANSITRVPTVTVVPTATSIPAPWQTVSNLAYGKGIAFGHSDPLTGYVCGTPEGVGATHLRFGITHDGGHTWQAPIITSIPGNDCHVYVNPYIIQDLVIGTRPCWKGCDNSDTYYRSLDAGLSWVPQVAPAGNEASGLTAFGFPRWTPTALFFMAELPGASGGPLSPPKHYIAVSVNGGPLAWTATNPDFGTSIYQTPNSANILGTQLVVTDSNNDALSTTDNGQSWHTITLADNLQAHIVTTYTGQTLLAENSASSYSISHDGGQSWQTLPAFPDAGSPSFEGQAFMAPDTTIFLDYASGNPTSTPTGIYRLAPGSPTWVWSAPAIATGFLTAVSWDVAGHPRLLWSVGSTVDNSLPPPNDRPAIEFHSA